MDFELNQSSTDCDNGVNPVRTAGDLLIEYRIEQGGATANIKVRKWTGSAWGAATDLTLLDPPLAAGTINDTAIPAGESDGISATNPISPRTFGEAQLDLDFVFDEGSCESFGSAFLKSRASDSFPSQLKDLIRPVPVNITNCGTVIIRKVTDPASDPSTTMFGYTKTFGTAPATPNTLTLGHGQDNTFNNVLFGTGYTVTEDSLPAGWDFVNIDCNVAEHPSVGVTPSISGATVTFDIDNAADVLDCTYTNRARGTIIVEKVTNDGSRSFDFTSNTLMPSPFTLATTAPGQAGKDSDTFANQPCAARRQVLATRAPHDPLRVGGSRHTDVGHCRSGTGRHDDDLIRPGNGHGNNGDQPWWQTAVPRGMDHERVPPIRPDSRT